MKQIRAAVELILVMIFMSVGFACTAFIGTYLVMELEYVVIGTLIWLLPAMGWVIMVHRLGVHLSEHV